MRIVSAIISTILGQLGGSARSLSFENKKLNLEQLTEIAKETGEPEKISGKQEMFESLVNQFL